jgi:hypothetical protein
MLEEGRILFMSSNARTMLTQPKKTVEVLRTYFTSHFGASPTRECTLNWEALGIHRHDLHNLDRDVTEDEIKTTVVHMPPEKAPGPNGYIGVFFKNCGDIVKADLIAAMRNIFNLSATCWNLLNSANVTLIAKKKGTSNR